MKISVSSYSYSQCFENDGFSCYDVIQKSAELGFDAVEFIDLPGESYEEKIELAKGLSEKAKECNIAINAYTVSANMYWENEDDCQKEVDRLKKQVDIAAILGAPVMRHDACWSLSKIGNGRSFDLMLPTIAKNTRTVCEYARTKGIVTCTENHGYIAQDSDRMERLYNAVNDDNFGLLVDMGNFACVDENSDTAVSKVAPYAVHVHAKDFKKYADEAAANGNGFPTRAAHFLQGVAIGDGDIPVAQCVNILKMAKYDGYITVEYEGSSDCIEGIKQGLANLKKYIG